jgi:hypothetical protein
MKPLGKLPLEIPKNEQEDNIMMHFRKMEVDGTGSKSFPAVDVGISGLETSCSVTRKVEECLLLQVLSNLTHIQLRPHVPLNPAY